MEQAQRHLANLVADVARQLPFRGEIPLSVSGSVLANAWFRRGFLKYVRETDLAVTWTPIRMDPARAIINHVPC